MQVQQVTQLADQYGASLVLYARQWTRDPDDALQEALLAFFQLDDLPRDSAAWLFTTVKRKALNHARRESRQYKHAESWAQQQDAWFEVDQDQKLWADEVCEQLQQLPAIEREIVVARVWGELRFEQIATLVGQSRSSVHRRYQAALAKLAAAVPDQDQASHSHNIRVVP